jgi:hypothetical protein
VGGVSCILPLFATFASMCMPGEGAGTRAGTGAGEGNVHSTARERSFRDHFLTPSPGSSGGGVGVGQLASPGPVGPSGASVEYVSWASLTNCRGEAADKSPYSLLFALLSSLLYDHKRCGQHPVSVRVYLLQLQVVASSPPPPPPAVHK